jgi:protocatechuate 3,4-dioxygenase beta subunit
MFRFRAALAAALLTMAILAGGLTPAAADDPTGTITGTLTDASGQPLAFATVVAETDVFDDYGFAGTDESGHYSMTVKPHDYRVRFDAPGYPFSYAHHAFSSDAAAVFTVAAGAIVQVDEQLLPTGRMTGRLTDTAGAPVTDWSVSVFSPDLGSGSATVLDADGRFTIEHLFAGAYTLMFINHDFTKVQYYHGKVRSEDADLVAVTANQTVDVAESLLPTGSVSVTAKDAVTGKKLKTFCAGVSGYTEGCTTTGTVHLDGIAQGKQFAYAFTNDGRYFGTNEVPVMVTGGTDTRLTVALRPAAVIETVVKDARTGAPVARICVAPMPAGRSMLPDGFGFCSDDQGVLRIGPIETGTYTLYAAANGEGNAYGDQWVGPIGGVGTQEQARRVAAKVGKVTSTPPIRMDLAGVVTGTVTSANGQPLADANVGNSAYDPGPGPNGRRAYTDESGHYRLEHLGPYAWPLLIQAPHQADQWSGGVGNRRTATLVNVTANAVFNPVMVAGVTVSGTVFEHDGSPVSVGGRLIAYNSVGGDVIGVSELDANGGYQLLLVGGQKVKLRLERYDGNGTSSWYGGSDFGSATAVPIPRNRNVMLDVIL